MLSQSPKDIIVRARAMFQTAPSINKSPGLGDRVAAFLKMPVVRHAVKAVTGIDTRKPCGGCKKRQAWLNKIGV